MTLNKDPVTLDRLHQFKALPEDELIDDCSLTEDGALKLKTLRLEDTLDGGDVLPGFTVPVRRIFNQ
jgi:hypothetical protein